MFIHIGDKPFVLYLHIEAAVWGAVLLFISYLWISKIHFWISKNIFMDIHSHFWISINQFLDIQKSVEYWISIIRFMDIQK